jgi:glycosyltransferase involved in cell wall biosynthesis
VKLSVVVPVFNEGPRIERFLRQFDDQTLPRPQFEVIVVDGGSDDGTQDIAARFADRVVTQSSEGIGGARNDGVAVARAPIVATTDADCVVPRDWLERMARPFADPSVVAVCGPDGPIERTLKARAVYAFLRAVVGLGAAVGLYTTGGANSGFRRETFLGLGGYRSLPHSDDVEIAKRLKQRGRIVYDPRLAVKVSMRRMARDGYLRTLFTWLRGDLKVLTGQPLEARPYARQRYD